MTFNKNLFSKKHSYLTLLTAAGGTTVIAACSFTLSGSGRENTEQVQVKIPEAEETSSSSIISALDSVMVPMASSVNLIKEQAASGVDRLQQSCMTATDQKWYNEEYCKTYRKIRESQSNR